MTEYWEDIIPDPDEDGIEAYNRFYNDLHEFIPGTEFDMDGFSRKAVSSRCIAIMYRNDGTEYICNGTSHSSFHLPIDGCCYCKHGVYIHTSYDIPCGRCEAGEDWEDEV